MSLPRLREPLGDPAALRLLNPEVYRLAARQIREIGWCRGLFELRPGLPPGSWPRRSNVEAVCAIGAIGLATSGDAFLSSLEYEIFADRCLEPDDRVWGGIVFWNDNCAESGNEVAAVLEEIALILERVQSRLRGETGEPLIAHPQEAVPA